MLEDFYLFRAPSMYPGMIENVEILNFISIFEEEDDLFDVEDIKKSPLAYLLDDFDIKFTKEEDIIL